jgi:hypothetical protein
MTDYCIRILILIPSSTSYLSHVIDSYIITNGRYFFSHKSSSWLRKPIIIRYMIQRALAGGTETHEPATLAVSFGHDALEG